MHAINVMQQIAHDVTACRQKAICIIITSVATDRISGASIAITLVSNIANSIIVI
jgi:hypothetical protein